MPPNSRLASLLRPWSMIWFSIRCASGPLASIILLTSLSATVHWEALTEAVRRDGLAALVRIRQIRDAASAKLFCITSANFIAFEDTTVVPSLVQAASGVILDLGPGAGNQIHRFDSSRVEYIYGVEPNRSYQEAVNAKLASHSLLRDKYKLIVCGVEDSDVLREEGICEGSLDSVLCIQVLCAVEDPKSVMREVWKLLKPGGKFIFWEHGWSRNRWTTVAQALYNPAWSTFVGCRLTQNVLADILNSGEWENPGDIEEPEDPFSCLPRIQGVLVKKA
ncbi:S-adenosyl-L-methionine-dependent methyltransferase [Aspergillus aurantiobrunneus]